MEPKRIRSRELLHPMIREDLDYIEKPMRRLGFSVFETWRSPERQNWLYAQGKSRIRTLGYHSFGLAVDIVSKEGYQWKWDYKDKDRWFAMAAIMKGLCYGWGGEWKSIQDYPHYQLTFGLSLKSLRAGILPDTGAEAWGVKIRQAIGLP